MAYNPYFNFNETCARYGLTFKVSENHWETGVHKVMLFVNGVYEYSDEVVPGDVSNAKYRLAMNYETFRRKQVN